MIASLVPPTSKIALIKKEEDGAHRDDRNNIYSITAYGGLYHGFHVLGTAPTAQSLVDNLHAVMPGYTVKNLTGDTA